MQVSLEYGWLPCSIGELLLEIDWKSAIECLKILKTRINRKDFILLLRHLLVLYAVNPNQVAIYSLYCYIKSETNDEERRSIIGPVTCKISQDLADKLEDGIKHVTIPMISLNFKNYQFAMELIDEMTPEELEQQNELGDTCLHLQLGYDNEVIEKMIEKQPNLTKILNKQQRSILRARTLEQDHYRYPLILKLLTQYEMDYLQKDIMDIYPLHSENNIPQYAFNPETKTLLNLVQTRNYAFF
ncbi:predicted protein [Naegleria gruberi]|uniref:Predicted protein n=1 Tax=Naegleria gruberi TaxID=5762 RepID=D2VN38_NAEGR|nr:uncharacterized protein NAEGRDRAFT_50913 [Naegleria gruberi]EFC41927.1 predicted protein [Naegleria gruberi]|eukprot:XP_002674671.1 predicted protein [Naegleria gruberi strain NEG-M]